MACLRYDPTTRSFFEIKPSQMTKRDTGAGLTFAQQIQRGYRRVEEKAVPYAGKASNIKKIWSN